MPGISRRSFVGGLAAGTALVAATPTGAAAAAGGRAAARQGSGPETRPLDELYQAAIAEGGGLVVYAGGDSPTQADPLRRAWATAFPQVPLTVRTDLSKYHDARIDNQLTRGRLEPDVVQLQTLQDFDRWKRDGELLAYKPAGWDEVYREFKDPGGHYVGIMVLAFSYLTNNRLVPAAEAPRSALDFLDPRYTNKLTLVWPNDDDAVLFMYKKIIDRYGWGWLDKLMTQQPTFVRGVPGAAGAVASGAAAATIAGVGSLVKNPASPFSFHIPAADFFQSWAQTAAIFAKAKHPAAAKLYLNWVLSKQFQTFAIPQWSVRKDVPPPAGVKPVLEYGNTSHDAFHKFMLDRTGVELFKSQLELYVGAPQGANPAGTSGPVLGA